MSMKATDTILSSRDAGHLLSLTPSGVRRLAETGQLASFRDSTGRRLFWQADVEALVRRRALAAAHKGRLSRIVFGSAAGGER